MKRVTRVLSGMLWMAVAASALAGPQTFDFKDPKGVNTMYFLLDSKVEPIMGLASGITGEVVFDPASPATTTGKIVVDVATLHTQNDGMTQTLFKSDWLDLEQFKTIEFTFKRVSDVKPAGENAVEMKVTGDFTCRGVTKEITIPVKATLLKDGVKIRMGERGSGDLLVLRAQFTISRKDFGIKPDMGVDVVADEIEIRASIAGGAKQ